MEEKIENIRHSLAHILAYAVKDLYKNVKFGVGPVIENGFYYDFDLEETISEDDLQKIEKRMRQIIAEDYKFIRENTDLDEAKQKAKEQPYKLELINDLETKGSTDAYAEAGGSEKGVDLVSFYTIGEFTDLCRGGHAESTGEVGAFKLMRVSGAYWRGDENNPQMQRVYGVAFKTQAELDEYLKQQELAKERDHRKLGKELDLFFISEDVGQGLPLMMPRGEVVKELLMRYMRQEEKKRGYTYVSTPILAQEKLYQRSGHADYYLEDMYSTAPDEEGNKFFVAPMNCPHHHMIFEKMVQSYNDMPLRLSEHAGLYRYELSGTLTGLIRMRGPITQNDSHTYVTEEQLREELKNLMLFFAEVYKQFNFEDYWYRVSLPDFSKDKYGGDKDQWMHAAKVITEVLEEIGANFVSEEGEAAFYGPKIDVQTKNVNGKEDSIATMQIDVLVPKRMGLTYVDADNNPQYPYVIHKSIMGAFERFMGFLIEQTGGNLPFWLAPEQVRILTINDKVEKYVEEITSELTDVIIMEPLKYNELRFTVDGRNESLGKKIREARNMRIPILMIVGPRDEKNKTVSLKMGEKEETIGLGELKEFITNYNS